MTKTRLLEKLDAEVERWNRAHPIGTPIKIAPDCLGIAWEHRMCVLNRAERTTSAAFVHGGAAALVYVNGVAIAVPLEACTPC